METIGKSVTDTNDMTNSVAKSVDQATSSAHKAIDKATDAARPAVDRVAAGAHQVVDKLAGAATNAADTITMKKDQLQDVQARLTDSCREYVQENPITSLGIAVAAGFVLSRLLSSR
ncbi:MAG: DUF883 C-terminal domain-containing protein [Casimicrobiaceae bacterium]